MSVCRRSAPRRLLPPLVAVVAILCAAGVTAAARVHGSTYRPPPIPPVLKPRLPREGVWRPAGQLIAGAPPVLVATFRPDARNPFTVAYVAWIDHTRTQLGLYPGLFEPPGASPRGPAAVPNAERWRLLATFNGGFKYGHGVDGGFAVDGHTYVWLKHGLGTLVGYRDGRVDIVSWHGGPTPGPKIVFARQNLPLIVDGGRASPSVGNQLEWGATLGGGPAVWRTGVGVDRRGNLVYAAAGGQTAAGLAAILIRIGAVRAIELDINPQWPTFNVYTHRHGLHARMFVPNDQQRPTRYLVPDNRDFFTVYRRIGTAPAGVPFR
jgi:Phosphodiester glycosidase